MRGTPASAPVVFSSLPVRIAEQRPSFAPAAGSVVLAALLGALLSPFALVLEELSRDEAARAILSDRPQAALLLALGAAGLLSLLAWPVVRLLRALLVRRAVLIEKDLVTGSEATLFGRRHWREPMATYAGVVHRVRASLSGTRHELVLVHPDHRRSVLLAVAPRIEAADIAAMAGLLDLAEISSRDATRLTPFFDLFGPASPDPELAVAHV